MKSGIYKIQNLLTGDCYIGSSKIIVERWQRHRKDLRKQKHHSVYLQRAWNKYTEYAFVFGVIEYCDEKELCDKENQWLKLYRPVYNMCPEAYSQIGRKLSPEHIAKIKVYVRANNVKPPESTWKNKQKKVTMLDKVTGIELQEFESISSACRFLGKDSTWSTIIANVCNNVKRSTALGYKWKWT